MKNMNKKNKIIIVIGVILVLGIGIFIILNRNNIFDNKKLGVNEPITEKINVDSKINEITVVDSRIEKLGKMSNIYIKIKNNTDDVIDKSDLKLTIYDKDNNMLLVSIINNVEMFEKEEEREVQVSTNNNITNANKYVVEKVIKN